LSYPTLIEAFVEDGAKHASHKLGFLTAKTFFIFLSLSLSCKYIISKFFEKINGQIFYLLLSLKNGKIPFFIVAQNFLEKFL